MENEKEVASITVEVPKPIFDHHGIMWRQEGYMLIGILPNGSSFAQDIRGYRIQGVDGENKPILKKIDI